jgi:transposase
VVSRGPSNDASFFPEAMRQAARVIHWDRLLADMAYDAESHHRLCREELGIRSTVIPLNPRGNPSAWPQTQYRRQMKRRFPRRIYGHRWQAESAFSQDKRVLGSALRSRHPAAQYREGYLRVLTHNLMILRLPPQDFNRAPLRERVG